MGLWNDSIGKRNNGIVIQPETFLKNSFDFWSKFFSTLASHLSENRRYISRACMSLPYTSFGLNFINKTTQNTIILIWWWMRHVDVHKYVSSLNHHWGSVYRTRYHSEGRSRMEPDFIIVGVLHYIALGLLGHFYIASDYFLFSLLLFLFTSTVWSA